MSMRSHCPEANGRIIRSIHVSREDQREVAYLTFDDGCCLKIGPNIAFHEHGGSKTFVHLWVHLLSREEAAEIEGLPPPSAAR
jgi:hypothetical protein